MALFLVRNVLDAFPHGAGVVFLEIGLHLLYGICFSSLRASVHVRSSLPVGLPVSQSQC